MFVIEYVNDPDALQWNPLVSPVIACKHIQWETRKTQLHIITATPGFRLAMGSTDSWGSVERSGAFYTLHFARDHSRAAATTRFHTHTHTHVAGARRWIAGMCVSARAPSLSHKLAARKARRKVAASTTTTTTVNRERTPGTTEFVCANWKWRTN